MVTKRKQHSSQRPVKQGLEGPRNHPRGLAEIVGWRGG